LSSAARTVSKYLDGVRRPDEGPPPGEYDDLVWPIMRLLVDGAPPAAIAAYLYATLPSDYGIACPPDADALAERLRQWWDAHDR